VSYYKKRKGLDKGKKERRENKGRKTKFKRSIYTDAKQCNINGSVICESLTVIFV
jgi:hypothetical protein